MVSGKITKRKALGRKATQEPLESQEHGIDSHAAAFRNTIIALIVMVLLVVIVGFGTFFALKTFFVS